MPDADELVEPGVVMLTWSDTAQSISNDPELPQTWLPEPESEVVQAVLPLLASCRVQLKVSS